MDERTSQPDNAPLGDFLRALRKSRRVTMEGAAQEAGIHRATLYRWETGRAQPCLPELQALLSALGASEQQGSRAIALVDAPRARTLARLELTRAAGQTGLEAPPHGGDLLRAMRLRRGAALDATALRLEITTSTLRRWERGDVWPSVKQLHRLCYALKAEEAELHALTCGPFARSSPIADASLTATKLAERVEQFTQSFFAPPYALKDLELLTLRAEAWAVAGRGGTDASLLSFVHAVNCRYLAYRDRHRESAAAAERYFDGVPLPERERHGPMIWAIVRIVGAMSGLQAAGPRGARRCLDALRRVLPFARNTVNESNALMRIAGVLQIQGYQEEALRAATEAYQAARRTLSEERAEWVRGEVGIHCIRSERYEEGLSMLSTGRQGDWYRLVETSLWKAQALAGMEEKGEAQRWLTQAQADLARYEITPLQPHLDALQTRLYGEKMQSGENQPQPVPCG